MSGTNEDPIGNEETDAAHFEQGAHAMTPDEAGVPSLAEVLAQSGEIHRQVAGTMEGVGGFPETRDGYPDTEKD